MLEVARALCERYDNIELVKASAESLPLPAGEFDGVTSCIAFHHFPDPEGALTEIVRVLRPGGRLFICDMCGEGVRGRAMLAYGRLKRADHYYFDRNSLTGMIAEAGLELIDAKYYRVFPRVILAAAIKPKNGVG
jgi:ubiquinone/menaquinone biosynthesis C-methylase UbiE